MTDDRRHRSIAKRRHETECIADDVEPAVRREVAVVVRIPAHGPSVSTLVGSDHVVASLGQRNHDPPPAVRELREAVEQQHARALATIEASLEHVHRQTIDVADQPRANARRQQSGRERTDIGWCLCPDTAAAGSAS